MEELRRYIYSGIVFTGILAFAGAIFCASPKNISFVRTKATNDSTIILNSSNSPTLTNGEGTTQDQKNVTWEYHNASDYASGHVSLSHEGYFGVSQYSPYGVTGISELTITFNAGSAGELWLLNSIDGINWGEVEMVKKPDETSKTSSTTTSVNDWRYIRFYYYDTNSGSIAINNVTISYSCSGISAQEDVDSAKDSNVVSTSSNLTHAPEYVDLSPNSSGGEAISFTKSDTVKSEIVLGFGKTYKVGPTQNAKIEFDMKTANIAYGKTIQLMNGSSTLGSNIDSSKASSYKCTNIQDDWYHIEVPITTLISVISGYYPSQDKPPTNVQNKEYNGIKINAGTCIIDNLRVTSTQCDLGIFNNPTWKPEVGHAFWLKVSWVGILYPELVTITFNDDTLGMRIPLDDPNLMNGSPFYIELLRTGTLIITCTVVSGYNRSVHTVQHSITIN